MTSTAYDLHRESARNRQAAQTAAGQEIGSIPPIVDPARRAQAENDFAFFCTTYFPEVFSLPWSPDHLKILEKVQRVVIDREMFAEAMPRGSGKTTIALMASLWAALTGRHLYIQLVNATADSSARNLVNLKYQLRYNDLLMEDFPEVCYPIRQLRGEARRCTGQTVDGKNTNISWTADQIIFPTIEGSKSSGVLIRYCGITGEIRGPMHFAPDGTAVRPSLVIVDDPQTDQSARSPSQCLERLAVINGAIAGLAGPGKRTAILIPCTVIRQGDLADTILDNAKSPQWQGERTKSVYAWPKREDLWEECRQIRVDQGKEAAAEFVRQNFAAMHEGASVAWEERKGADDVSALHHQYQIRWDIGDAAYFAEYQNEPIIDAQSEGAVTADAIATKTNGIDRWKISPDVNHLTAFIDVQHRVLYYAMVGWKDDFTGYVVDYGCFPDQKAQYFVYRNAKRNLAQLFKGAGLEGTIHGGLTALVDQLAKKEYQRVGGGVLRLSKILVDVSEGVLDETITAFCRTSPYASILLPSRGKGIGPTARPMAEWTKQPGVRVGHRWRIVTGLKRTTQHVMFDTNYWKSFIHSRFATAMGDKGCLSLWGNKPDVHRMIADHCTAEICTRKKDGDRQVDVWKSPPNAPDNHLFDCLVGCAVAASIVGSTLPNSTKPAAKKKWTIPEHLRK